MTLSGDAPRVWVVKTNAIGDLRAAEGIAANINPNFTTIDISDDFTGKEYTDSGMVATKVRDILKRHFNVERLSDQVEWPDVIISSGRHSCMTALAIKNLAGKKPVLVQSQRPSFDVPLSGFDVLYIPEHSRRDTDASINNIMYGIGVPHAVTPEKIEQGVKDWQGAFSHLPHPIIAVMLGGSAGSFKFTPDVARKMAAELKETAKALNASLVVTNSRRTDEGYAATGETPTKAFMDELGKAVPSYLHEWKMTDQTGDPYFGILGIADAIVAPADSMSMCCEATATKKPVYIYAPEGTIERHQTLTQQLCDLGYAKPFEDLVSQGIQPVNYEPPNVAKDIAEKVKSILQQREKQIV